LLEERRLSPDELAARKYIIPELERLLALPLAKEGDIERWNQVCESVQQEVRQKFPHFVFAEGVQAFFREADYRANSVLHRDVQHGEVMNYISRLKDGIPDS
jgi:hypothetical protein